MSEPANQARLSNAEVGIEEKWFGVEDGILIHEAATSRAIREISCNATFRAKFLKALTLDIDLDYVDLLRAYGVIDGLEADHLRKHWYPEPDECGNWPKRAWWVESQPIVNTMRHSMREAFEISEDTGLPIDYYWVVVKTPEGAQDIPVSSHVIRHEHYILLVRVTPEPPPPKQPRPQSIAKILDDILDASNRHDVNALMAFFAEDAILDQATGSEIYGQRIEGKANIQSALEAQFDSVASLSWEVLNTHIIGKKAIREYRRRAMTKTGVMQDFHTVDIFTFHQGLITKQDSYFKQRTGAGGE